jgi:hypothetical protein
MPTSASNEGFELADTSHNEMHVIKQVGRMVESASSVITVNSGIISGLHADSKPFLRTFDFKYRRCVLLLALRRKYHVQMDYGPSNLFGAAQRNLETRENFKILTIIS